MSNYRYEGILYYLVRHPRCTDAQIASALNYSPAWVNTIRNSIIFQQRLAQFREEVWRGVREKEVQDPPPAPPGGPKFSQARRDCVASFWRDSLTASEGWEDLRYDSGIKSFFKGSPDTILYQTTSVLGPTGWRLEMVEWFER